ncbi:hypothetical protein AB205_0168950, partial [Aquarana catesbeiana]
MLHFSGMTALIHTVALNPKLHREQRFCYIVLKPRTQIGLETHRLHLSPPNAAEDTFLRFNFFSSEVYCAFFHLFRMNRDFSSPAAEMAEMNRMQYEIDYTEGISQRMRVPEKLKVASSNTESDPKADGEISYPGSIMQVPERIVVTGQSEDGSFSRPADLDLIQTTPFEPLSLKTPPRVLTLSERPLDFLDLERTTAATPQSEEVKCH